MVLLSLDENVIFLDVVFKIFFNSIICPERPSSHAHLNKPHFKLKQNAKISIDIQRKFYRKLCLITQEGM